MTVTSLPPFEDVLDAARARLAAFDYEELMRAGVARDPRDYYLLATYPPLGAMRPITAAEIYADVRGDGRLYVHIPFCQQYCTFCHYTKEINPKLDRVSRYLAALEREIELAARHVRPERFTINHVFFGGGTPSYLDHRQLDRLLTRLRAGLGLAVMPDFFFELHPGIVRRPDRLERLRVLREHGVSCWVFGVQSMDEKVLRRLNRGHGRAEVFEAIELVHREGGTDLSLDLIFGLPHQSLRSWYDTLVELIGAGVRKFNIFPLMFKPTDPIYRHYLRRPEIFADGPERLLMLTMGEIVLEQAGFGKGPIMFYSAGEHAYEPLEDLDAVGDKVEGLDLLPLGVSSFGRLAHTQFFNHCKMDDYLDAVEAGGLPVWRGAPLPREERMRRAMMINLRARGVRRSAFVRTFGVDPAEAFPEVFALLRRYGLLLEENDVVRLSPRGQLDASSVAARFASPAVIALLAEEAARQRPEEDEKVLEAHNFSPLAHRGIAATAAAARSG